MAQKNDSISVHGIFHGVKLAFLLCMTWGLCEPRCQGEICSCGIPGCRRRQLCPRDNPVQLSSSAMGVLEMKAYTPGHQQMSNLCTPHSQVLLLDSFQKGASPPPFQTASVTCSGEGVGGRLAKGQFRCTAEMQEYRFLSWINKRADIRDKFA